MKKTMKMISGALCACMALSTVTGCAKDKEIDPTIEDTKNLYLMILNRGYGTDWLKKIGAEFEKKTGINVDITVTSDELKLISEMKKGPTGSDMDIYFNLNDSFGLKNTYVGMWKEYPDGLLDLTDLYTKGVVDGETVTFGEKMNATYKDAINMGTQENPKYYTSLWSASIMGMTYNITVLNELFPNGYELPKTTDELKDFARAVKDADGTAFVSPGQLDYFSGAMFFSWWAQHQGYEEYKNFYQGLSYDETYEQYVLSKNIFNQKGRLKALEVMEELLDYDNGLYYKNGLSYNDSNFEDLQVIYLTKKNKIAMMPNGDWLAEESSYDGSCEVGMMKTPVISSITDRLQVIKTEENLRKAIDFVDGDTSVEFPGLDEEKLAADIAEIREARNMSASLGLSHVSYSPAYTNAKANVYKFYQYMASDEALKIFKKNVNGGFMPFNTDYTGITMTKFEQDVAEIMKNLVYAGKLTSGEICNKGGVSAIYFADGTAPDRYLASPKSSATHKTAQQLFDMYKYTDSEWNEVLRKIR